MQSIGFNRHSLVEKIPSSDIYQEKGHQTMTEQLDEQQGGGDPLCNRKEFFNEINRLKDFQHRDVAKKGLTVRDSQLQLDNYNQMLSENQSKRLINDKWLSLLTDDPALPGSLVELKNNRSILDGRQAEAHQQGTLAEIGTDSSREFCEQIAKIIGETRKDYLEIYEKVLEKYITFFSSLSDILSALPQLISDGKDNKVAVNAGQLKKLLEKLKNSFKDQILYPTDSSKKITEIEARDWAEKLGLPASCVQSDGKGSYIVKFDLLPVDEMITGLEAVSDGEISSAKYQAWKAGFDAQVEKVNNYVQTLSQKYTTANSTYDNLVKVLAGTINAMYEADKEYLKN